MSEIQEKQLDHLIFEMTLPFSQEEQLIFGNLCGKMAEDTNFRNQYTSHIKSMYVHNYMAIKNGKLNRKPFSCINDAILKAIEKGKKPQPSIDPTLNKTDTNTAQTLAKIKSIKETIINK